MMIRNSGLLFGHPVVIELLPPTTFQAPSVASLPPPTSRQWRIQKFWKGGGRKTIYQPRFHLSSMHRAIY